ncbi:hypothetical protein LVJ94_15735 [Pendulispora rubella]|uniref:Thaumatin-like protein n=1 Tax=Pendulispora rubella TaxID=2741070 RepID=A0ABZ2LE85_9BACT
MRHLYSVFALAASSVIGLMACASEAPQIDDDETQTPGRKMRVLGGGGDDEKSNGLPAEALKPAAFDLSAALRQGLWKAPLAKLQALADEPTSSGDAIRKSLQTKETRALMNYIVSCALPPEEVVKYDPHDGTHVVWRGGLGLCPEWQTNDNVSCRDTVSSCVVARTNALAAHIPISIRGPAGFSLELSKQVGTQRNYREKVDAYDDNGIPLESFEACSGGEAYGDVTRKCGWQSLYVGRCQAGSTITVTTPDSYCANGPAVMVRACKGIYGCQSGGPNPSHPYSEAFPDGGPGCANGKGAKLAFKCEPNGPKVGGVPTGYFSLMLAPQDPKEAVDAASVPLNFDVSGAPPSSLAYPASEEQVFTYPEGGFYGDLSYDATDNEKKRRRGRETLHGKMYACFSGIWQNGIAQLSERLCAIPSSTTTCFQYTPGACYASQGNRCAVGAPIPGPAYDDCKETQPTTNTWKEPITVFLNGPCDLASKRSDACAVKRQ